MTSSANQVDDKEIEVILRELKRVFDRNVVGAIVEFGCYLGDTSIHIARINEAGAQKKFYVYDSFEGLPEKSNQDNSSLGESFQAGELYASKKQFIKNLQKASVPMPIIKKAWFSEVQPNEVPEEICYAFLDGDYYQSIIDSFKLIEKRLASGATIIVDDYGNDALPGAKKAVDEWLKNKNCKLKIEQSLAVIYI